NAWNVYRQSTSSEQTLDESSGSSSTDWVFRGGWFDRDNGAGGFKIWSNTTLTTGGAVDNNNMRANGTNAILISSSGQCFDGDIDEVRILDGISTPDALMKAEYYSQTDAVISYGSEVEPVLTIDSIADNGPKYAGETITFTVNWSWDEAVYGEDVNIRICKTNSLVAGECGGGEWASDDNVSSSPNNLTYAAVSADHGTKDYYVFVYDASDNTNGADNNPQSDSFVITAPVIDSISDDGPKYAGQDISFTVDWTWANGNVDIRVCKTNSLTAGVCDGGEWISSLNKSSGSEILTHTSTASDVGDNDYYVFIYDHSNPNITGYNNPQSDSFTIIGPTINSVVDSPDPAIVGDQVTFTVDWTWPIGNVNVFVCKADSCTSAGCVGGANQTWASTLDTDQDPVNLSYSTTSAGTKDYYVFIYDTTDSTLYSSSTHGTFDVNIEGIYFHFEPFRRRQGPTDYVSRWDLDEATGSTAYDRNTTTGNDLTISGASWSSSGRFYYALDFDGTNDSAYSTTVSAYEDDTLGAIALDFYTQDLSVDGTIFSICDWSTSEQTYLKLVHEAGSMVLTFNGIDEYGILSDSTNLEFAKTDPLTLCIKVNTTSETGQIVGHYNTNTFSNYGGYAIYLSGGHVYFVFGKYISSVSPELREQYLKVHTTTAIDDGEDHSVIITYSGSELASGIKIYIDGVEDTLTVDKDALVDVLYTGEFMLAAKSRSGAALPPTPTTYTDFYNGGLWDVRVFDHVITASEISIISNLSVMNSVDDEASWWQVNSGSTTTLVDVGSNGYDLTLVGIDTSNWSSSSANSGILLIKMVVDGVVFFEAETDEEFDINTWYHVIIYQDGSGIKLYVDGVEQTLVKTYDDYKYSWLKTLITDATNKADRIIFGAHGDTSANTDYYNGLLDNIKLYNTSLSTTDVEDIYGISSFTTGTNCSLASREKDESQIFNKIQVLGNNAISSSIVEDEASQQSYGIRELTYTDRSIESVSDADELANRILERYKDPIERITIEVQTRNFREVIGDVVKITDTNTGLSAAE
ncbi:MAG: LamG domain-containing protein, partial [Candidatus Nanoarchaeia archaeon]